MIVLRRQLIGAGGASWSWFHARQHDVRNSGSERSLCRSRLTGAVAGVVLHNDLYHVTAVEGNKVLAGYWVHGDAGLLAVEQHLQE